jgi:hypothetical protein
MGWARVLSPANPGPPPAAVLVAAPGRKKGPLSRALDLREADSTFVRFTGKTFGGSSCRLLGGVSSYLWFVLRAPGYFLIEPEAASAKTLISVNIGSRQSWRAIDQSPARHCRGLELLG